MKSFEDLLLPLQKDLYQLAITLTGNDADALDLVQDTYLKAYRNFKKFREGTNIKAWAAKIMKNAYIDVCRRRKAQPVIINPVEEALKVEPSHELPAEAILSEDVARALEELEKPFRVLILLCDVYKLSYKEIGDVLDIPMGTCMSRLHRARNKLKEIIIKHRYQTSDSYPR